MIVLFQSISGGIDWGDPFSALTVCGEMYSRLYMLFICFTQFAVLNIVTGQFVEESRLTASQDLPTMVNVHNEQTAKFREAAMRMFRNADDDFSGSLDAEELRGYLEEPNVKALFSALELDLSDLQEAFSILDEDGSGSIDAEEFVRGIFQMRGRAKSV